MPTVRFFAGLKDIVRAESVQIEAEEVGALLEALRSRYGAQFVDALRFCKVAVNGRSIEDLDGLGTQLEDLDEVALLPPVSGG